MGLSLREGDYVPDGTGGLRRTGGQEALLERVLFRLTARRGSFPFLPELGSRLWQLGQLPAVAAERGGAVRGGGSGGRAGTDGGAGISDRVWRRPGAGDCSDDLAR